MEYEVINPAGVRVMYGPERCRYPAAVERQLMAAGYKIRLNGKRVTKPGAEGGAANGKNI